MMTKNKSKKIITYVLFTALGIVYYMHSFLPKENNEVLSSKEEYLIAKNNRTKSLQKVKDYTIGSKVYKNYLIEKEKAKIAWNKLRQAKREQMIFGFPTFRLFLERFSLMLCIFTYALFNLIRSVQHEKNLIYTKIIHCFILSICFFSFFWIFQTFQDFNRVTYILMTLFSAAILFVAINLFMRRKKFYEDKIRNNMVEIAKVAIVNSHPEKREDTVDAIEKIANS